MAAYMILTREGPVRDEAEMAEYARKNRENAPVLGKTMVPLAVYGRIEVLEGDAPDGVVILKFETLDAARAWYDSPEYQDALPHRLRGADYRAIIVEGL